MARTKTIKFLKPWLSHAKDSIATPNVPIADLLIQRGIAEEVVTEKKKPILPVAPTVPSLPKREKAA